MKQIEKPFTRNELLWSTETNKSVLATAKNIWRLVPVLTDVSQPVRDMSANYRNKTTLEHLSLLKSKPLEKPAEKHQNSCNIQYKHLYSIAERA